MPFAGDIHAIACRESVAVERTCLLAGISPGLRIVEIEIKYAILVHSQTFAQGIVHQGRIHLAFELPGRDTNFGMNDYQTAGEVTIFC